MSAAVTARRDGNQCVCVPSPAKQGATPPATRGKASWRRSRVGDGDAVSTSMGAGERTSACPRRPRVCTPFHRVQERGKDKHLGVLEQTTNLLNRRVPCLVFTATVHRCGRSFRGTSYCVVSSRAPRRHVLSLPTPAPGATPDGAFRVRETPARGTSPPSSRGGAATSPSRSPGALSNE